jgi:hypothetical protein
MMLVENKKMVGFAMVVLFATLLTLLLVTDDSNVKPQTNAGMAVQVYYDNYSFLREFRDKNEVYGKTVTRKQLVNTRTVVDSSNRSTKLTPTVGYSFTKKTGHNVNIKISADFMKVFSAEAGYTFLTEKSETTSTSVPVPPRTRVIVRVADSIIKSTHFDVYVTPQQWYLRGWDGFGYWNDGPRKLSPTTNNVREFSGVQVDFLHSAIR